MVQVLIHSAIDAAEGYIYFNGFSINKRVVLNNYYNYNLKKMLVH